MNAAPYKNQSDVVPASIARYPNRQSWPRIIAALAVCLLIAAGIGVWLSRNDEQQLATDSRETSAKSTFASVALIIGAEWDDDNELSIGDRLSARTIQLRSGFLRVAFDDGVEVTLQGPAAYELRAAGKTKLKSGLLTATVPAGAEGFTVDTQTAEVLDLGTAFGIDLQEDGVSRISVIEGEVEVTLPDSTEKRLLKEGDAVRIEDELRRPGPVLARILARTGPGLHCYIANSCSLAGFEAPRAGWF